MRIVVGKERTHVQGIDIVSSTFASVLLGKFSSARTWCLEVGRSMTGGVAG